MFNYQGATERFTFLLSENQIDTEPSSCNGYTNQFANAKRDRSRHESKQSLPDSWIPNISPGKKCNGCSNKEQTDST